MKEFLSMTQTKKHIDFQNECQNCIEALFNTYDFKQSIVFIKQIDKNNLNPTFVTIKREDDTILDAEMQKITLKDAIELLNLLDKSNTIAKKYFTYKRERFNLHSNAFNVNSCLGDSHISFMQDGKRFFYEKSIDIFANRAFIYDKEGGLHFKELINPNLKLTPSFIGNIILFSPMSTPCTIKIITSKKEFLHTINDFTLDSLIIMAPLHMIKQIEFNSPCILVIFNVLRKELSLQQQNLLNEVTNTVLDSTLSFKEPSERLYSIIKHLKDQKPKCLRKTKFAFYVEYNKTNGFLSKDSLKDPTNLIATDRILFNVLKNYKMFFKICYAPIDIPKKYTEDLPFGYMAKSTKDSIYRGRLTGNLKDLCFLNREADAAKFVLGEFLVKSADILNEDVRVLGRKYGYVKIKRYTRMIVIFE